MQIDLFNNGLELETLKKEIYDVRMASNNVRRGIFARHNELCKLFLEQQQEIDQLKSQLQGQIKYF